MTRIIWKKTMSNESIMLLLILLFMISTLIQGILPLSINRIITFIMLVLVLYKNLKFMTRKKFVVLGLLIFYFIYTSIISIEISLNIKDWIYFATTVLLVEYFSDAKSFFKTREAILNYKNYIGFIVFLCIFITAISLVFSSNYAITWGSSYYIGFARNAHVVASSLCLLLSFTLLSFKNEVFSLVRLAILLFLLLVIFMTGARTYIVPAVIIVYLYIKGNLNNNFLKFFVYGIILAIVIYIFINSNMLDKFIWSSDASNQYADSGMISMTGGRSAFWIIDLKEYSKFNIFYLLFGHGFDYVYQVNKMYYNLYIWAHNDVIDLLLSIGATGTILYLTIWKNFFKRYKRHIMNKSEYRLFVIYIIFPMLFNGLFTYQHYLLSTFILAYYLENDNKRIPKSMIKQGTNLLN